MSLNVSLSSAVSSLLVVEKQMGVVSNNISNASTVGYTQESVALTARVTGGQVTGVNSTEATTYIDQFLEQSIIENQGTAAESSTYYSYYTTLSNALGSISSTSTGSGDLSTQLTNLETTLTSMATSPEDTALKTKAISELSSVCQSLRSVSTTIQNQRTQADQEIGNAISDANTQLKSIRDLNSQIASAKAGGQSTAALENQRYTALENLSSDLGITYYQDNDGNMQVYSDSGQPLLVGSVVNTLQHSASTSIGSSSVYTEGSSTGISGITTGGVDITDGIHSGKIAALVKMRDTDLVNAQSELDTLSSTLATTLNTIHNQGTSATAPQTLTGTASPAFTASSSVSVSTDLNVRVALLDSSGTARSYADIDLSGCSSASDIADAINSAMSSQTPSATCTLTASGQLQLSSDSSSYGVGITTLSGTIAADSTTLSDGDGTDVSSYFHLNDLLVSSGSAQTISVRSDIAKTPALMAAGELTSASSPTIPFTGVTSGDGTVASSLSSALSNSSQSFDASGYLSSTSKAFSDYAALIVSDISQRYSDAQTTSSTNSATLSTMQTTFSSECGVNTDEQMAKMTELQSMYSASAKVVSTVQSMFQSLISAVSA